MKPLGIDLFGGVGGWTDGLLAEDYDVIGFDIERHVYGGHRYPAQLVLQDVLTLHGSQFREAALIVASPPCQFFSYTAMPWTRAKDLAKEVRACPERTAKELALFNACFRIQREASEAAGRHIPMVVENVRGAQGWVGRARWSHGSFYLWGNVPALMPVVVGRKPMKEGIAHRANGATNFHGERPKFIMDDIKNGQRRSIQGIYEEGVVKVGGLNWGDHDQEGYRPKGFNVTAAQRYRETEGVKVGGSWFGKGNDCSPMRRGSSRSDSRKAASAMIAKIPLPLARHIARVYRPEVEVGLFGSL